MADTEPNVFRSSLDLVILKARSWVHARVRGGGVDRSGDERHDPHRKDAVSALHRLERKRWVDTEWVCRRQPPREVLSPDDGGAHALRARPYVARQAEAIAARYDDPPEMA